jgi:hypothetical protein
MRKRIASKHYIAFKFIKGLIASVSWINNSEKKQRGLMLGEIIGNQFNIIEKLFISSLSSVSYVQVGYTLLSCVVYELQLNR